MSFESNKKLGFGLMRLPKIGDDFDLEQIKNMVDRFLEAGYNYFDTAWRGPELLIQHISKEFDLEFMLVSSEPGSNIRRLVVFNNGIMTSEEELDDEEVAYWFGKSEEESA